MIDKSKPIGAAKITGFVIFLMLYFIGFFHRVAVPGTIFNQLQSDFAATATQISMLGSIFLTVYAVMQVFAGVLVDKLGAKRLIILGSAVMSAGAFGFAFSQSIILLFVFRVVIAIGTSIIYLSIVREISDVFSQKNFAIFVSVVMLVGYAGGIAATYPFERACYYWGWRQTLTGVSVFSTLILLVFIIFSKKAKTGDSEKVKISISDISAIVGNILTFPVYTTNSVTFAVYFLIQSSIGKKMLEDCFAYESDIAASHTFVLGIAGIFGAGLSGFLSRIINNRRKPLIAAGALLSISFLILMLLAINGIVGNFVVLPAYILLGLSTVSLPLCTASTCELNLPKVSGTAVGIMNAVCYAIVAILIATAGGMMDLFRSQAVVAEESIIYPDKAYISVLTMCLAISAISALTAFQIRETKGINISSA